ncbi:MAG: HAD family phosphatase [Lachnospiraceae bacterium]|nr:HAD family phosphatase [Lachnospiraceae bacterium]
MPQKTSVKAVIFDLDGTLIDTEKIYRMIWPQAMASLGYVFTEEMYLQLRSLGRPFAPRRFKEWFGEDFDYDNARRVRKGLFDAYVAKNGIQIKKGAIELLDFLHTKNIVTAIATATDLDRAKEYLDMVGLTNHFDRILSATMVDEGKPSPKVYQFACEELGLNPGDCMAVEDAPNGVKSANAAGLKVVMIPDQSEADDDLKTLLYAYLPSLDKIIDIIE